MDRFGASAPGDKCMANFGFTVENVVNKTKEIYKEIKLNFSFF